MGKEIGREGRDGDEGGPIPTVEKIIYHFYLLCEHNLNIYNYELNTIFNSGLLLYTDI